MKGRICVNCLPLSALFVILVLVWGILFADVNEVCEDCEEGLF